MVSICNDNQLWERLKSIRRMRFSARSVKGQSGWNGAGEGTVTVELAGPDSTLFLESGHWNTSASELQFTNRYRWTRHGDGRTIGLEHLRYGSENPVFLVELVRDSVNSWKSLEPHNCGNDCYTVEIRGLGASISMRWEVRGPDKDEHIHTIYS